MRDTTTRQRIDDVVSNTHQHFDSSGADIRMFDLIDDMEMERVTIRFDHNDEVPHRLLIYNEIGTDPSETIAFDDTNLQFSPISAIGDPGRDRLQGVTVTKQQYQNIPLSVAEVWKALGYTVVPSGAEWVL
jgi:hypothetical protein